MRLLFTLTAYPPAVGGAQALMHRLACQLAKSHELRVVTQWDERRTDWLLGTTVRAPSTPRAYEVDGIPVERLGLPAAARARLLPWAALYYAVQGRAIERIARELAGRMERWAANADVIHNCRIGREGLTAASLDLARRHRIPFVLTPVHHPRWGGFLHRHYQRMYREADAVIALTPPERDTLVALGVDAAKVHVTGMGPILADTHDGAAFRERRGLGAHPLVLFLGQKYAYKGVDTLLEAAAAVWQKAPETRFAFLGPRTRHSRRLFARHPDPRIVETDTVSLQEKTDALDACDVLCLPSTQESFGGVFTEAWALGKPVVGCDIPAVRAVIDHARDGFVAEATPASVAEHLQRLLADASLRAEMGARGREKVARDYDWPVLAAKTEEVYRQLRAEA